MAKENFSKEFEALYDEISGTTNKVSTALYTLKFEGRIVNEETLKRVDRVIALCYALEEAAHELEEHLAWD